MCECLLEAYETVDMPAEQVCELKIHTTYQLGLDAVDPLRSEPRVTAQTDLRAIWLTEDEI